MYEGIQELPKIEKTPDFDYEGELNEFLDDREKNLIGEEKIKEIENKTKEEVVETNSGKEVSYDKRANKFTIGLTETSIGELVASRHFGAKIKLPTENDKEAGALKQLRKKYSLFLRRDSFTTKLNSELAKKLSESETRSSGKKEAYDAIHKRETEGSEQEGVVAEKMMIGAIEMISIDRPDLRLEIRPSNARQDVEEKIDFIITTKKKRKNIGIEEKNSKEFDEKSFGIQFTTNSNKEEHKKRQIEKAKELELDVDDILYIAIDREIVHTALVEWEKKGKPISGPWGELNKFVKTKALENIFKNILSEEQIRSILTSI
ncbi:MAG TPA: hypothetical protein PK886_02865 [Candidatus Paceibacterota bacterium]|nr:hypothetical protein [Candidatus Paceibacterota bacterium]